MRRLGIAAILWCGLWLPPLRYGLESDMALHMTVQLPLLAAIGMLVVPVFCQREPRWLANADWLGIPGLVLVLFSSSYWMLPVTLDSTLSDWRMETAKFLSLPLTVGLPLGLSWPRMPPLGRAFVIANVISKLGAVGGLFLTAPVRLCAYYRLDQQVEAGWALVGIATVLALVVFLAAFCGWSWIVPAGSRSRPQRSAAVAVIALRRGQASQQSRRDRPRGLQRNIGCAWPSCRREATGHHSEPVRRPG